MLIEGYGIVPDDCLVIFTGSNCPACRQFERTLSEANLNIPVKYVSVERYSHAAALYGVMSLPTTFIIKDGIIKANLFGSVALPTVKKEMEES